MDINKKINYGNLTEVLLGITMMTHYCSEKEKISITKDEALKINFTFVINYEPNFANVEFKGHVVALPDKDEMKKILKEWKDKKLPEGIKTGIFNFIMSKCNIKALTLEDEMGLPTHVPMPRLSPKKQE